MEVFGEVLALAKARGGPLAADASPQQSFGKGLIEHPLRHDTAWGGVRPQRHEKPEIWRERLHTTFSHDTKHETPCKYQPKP